MINESVVRSFIRNRIILGGISRGGHYYNDYVFYPLGEDGYRDYRYYMPCFCITRKLLWDPDNVKKGGRIDIRKNREGNQSESLMNRGRNDQSTKLWERLRGIDCIRELIILLSDEDLDRFRFYLSREGYSEYELIQADKRYVWYQNYFSADFYLPGYRRIIELDSKTYHKFPGIDRARDLVLKESYGLDTTRFIRYDINYDKYEDELMLILENPVEVPYIFNQLELIVDRFIEDNLEYVKGLNPYKCRDA